MYCNECGAENPDQAKFCNSCGTKIMPRGTAVIEKQPEPSASEGVQKTPEKSQPVKAASDVSVENKKPVARLENKMKEKSERRFKPANIITACLVCLALFMVIAIVCLAILRPF